MRAAAFTGRYPSRSCNGARGRVPHPGILPSAEQSGCSGRGPAPRQETGRGQRGEDYHRRSQRPGLYRHAQITDLSVMKRYGEDPEVRVKVWPIFTEENEEKG